MTVEKAPMVWRVRDKKTGEYVEKKNYYLYTGPIGRMYSTERSAKNTASTMTGWNPTLGLEVVPARLVNVRETSQKARPGAPSHYMALLRIAELLAHKNTDDKDVNVADMLGAVRTLLRRCGFDAVLDGKEGECED